MNRVRIAVLSAAAAIVTSLAPVHAATLYQYNPGPWSYYAGNYNGYALFGYDRSPSWQFSLAGPLAANFSGDITASVTSWSLDGGKSITVVNNTTPGAGLALSVYTDALGNIYNHSFYVSAALQAAGVDPALAFAVPGGNFSYYSTYYDQLLVNPGPAYNPQLGRDLHGIPFYCGPPCSEYGHTYANFGPTPDYGRFTVSAVADPGPGTDPGAVPEPGAWALMLAGFGITGASLRRRRVSVSYA